MIAKKPIREVGRGHTFQKRVHGSACARFCHYDFDFFSAQEETGGVFSTDENPPRRFRLALTDMVRSMSDGAFRNLSLSGDRPSLPHIYADENARHTLE